jgi:hypothetical protein
LLFVEGTGSRKRKEISKIKKKLLTDLAFYRTDGIEKKGKKTQNTYLDFFL